MINEFSATADLEGSRGLSGASTAEDRTCI